MKKYLVPFLVVCSLSSQSRYAFVAGLNRADISAFSVSLGSPFEGGLNRSIEPDPDLGLRLGIEKK